MTDGTRMLVGTIAALAAVVAVFSIMASCSIQVAQFDGAAKAVCIQSGGVWSESLDYTHVGHCLKPQK